MVAYFDSSVLLSVLLNDSNAEQAANLWAKHTERLSSVLFEIECLTVLRRSVRQKTGLPKGWLSVSENRLANYLDQISLRTINGEITDYVKHKFTKTIARSLDVIHVATALFFQSRALTPIKFITFDKEQANCAKAMGLLLF